MAENFKPTKLFFFNNFEEITQQDLANLKEYFIPAGNIGALEDPVQFILDLYFKGLTGGNNVKFVNAFPAASGLEKDKNKENPVGDFTQIQGEHFKDLLRRVTGLGIGKFVVINPQAGIGDPPFIELPIPFTPRMSLFDSTVADAGQVTIKLSDKVLQNDKFTLNEVGEMSDDGNKALRALYRIFELINKQQESNAGDFFEDRNFVVKDLDEFSISARVASNFLNTFDVSNGDEFFTNGELDASKDETSLTYAYAFEQYQVAGTKELLLKEVKLTGPNNEEFVEQASNESGVTVVDKLKNIIYNGEKSADINATVLDPGGEGNIGVEKLYNIVTISIPKLPKNKRNIIDYIKTDKSIVNRPSNDNDFAVPLNYSSIGSYEQLAKLITETSFLRHAWSATEKQAEVVRNSLLNYRLGDSLVVDPDLAKSFLVSENLFKLTDSKKNVIENQFKIPATIISNGTSNNFSFVEEPNIGTNFIEKYLNGAAAFGYERLADLLFGFYDPRFANTATFTIQQGKGSFTNYNMSEMYQLLIKSFKFGPTHFPSISAFDAELHRNSRLSGLRVVKSTLPFDPYANDVTAEQYTNSIIQNFYIDVQQADEDKELTLFDSQVIYGKAYYYTVFGVYEVDGKFYSYTPGKLKFDETIVPGTTKQIIVDNVDQDDQFINPCCRFTNITKGSQLYQIQGSQQDIDDKLSISLENDFGLNEAKTFWKKVEKTEDNLDRSLTLKEFSDLLGPGNSKDDAVGVFLKNVKGLTDPAVFNLGISKAKPNSILPFLNDQYFYEMPFLTVYLYRAYNLAKNKKFIPTKGEQLAGLNNQILKYKNDPILGEGLIVKINNVIPIKTLSEVGVDETINIGSQSIKEAFNKRKNELFCLLCRRAADTNNPKRHPTISKLLTELLREYNVISDKNEFLGNILDCKKYGYLNSDGFGDVPFDSKIEIATRSGGPKTIDGKNIINNVLFSPANESANGERCQTKKTVNQTSKTFKSYSCTVNEMDSKSTVEVPITDIKVSTVARVPMPPDITFVPLADIDNKILIRFQERVQSEDYQQPIDDFLSIYNGETVLAKLKEQSKSEDFVLAASQNDLNSVIVLRTDNEPQDLFELITGPNSKFQEISWNSGELIDNLVPNKDYWYVFGTRDLTGLYSGASTVYRIKLVNDSGYTYVDLKPYEFVIIEEKTASKTFKKLIKIKPSFDETIPQNAEQIGTKKLFSTIKTGKTKGVTNAPPKFKIRVRSKKTKRAFDINLKFTQEVQKVKSAKLKKVIEERSELIDTKVEE